MEKEATQGAKMAMDIEGCSEGYPLKPLAFKSLFFWLKKWERESRSSLQVLFISEKQKTAENIGSLWGGWLVLSNGNSRQCNLITLDQAMTTICHPKTGGHANGQMHCWNSNVWMVLTAKGFFLLSQDCDLHTPVIMHSQLSDLTFLHYS